MHGVPLGNISSRRSSFSWVPSIGASLCKEFHTSIRPGLGPQRGCILIDLRRLYLKRQWAAWKDRNAKAELSVLCTRWATSGEALWGGRSGMRAARGVGSAVQVGARGDRDGSKNDCEVLVMGPAWQELHSFVRWNLFDQLLWARPCAGYSGTETHRTWSLLLVLWGHPGSAFLYSSAIHGFIKHLIKVSFGSHSVLDAGHTKINMTSPGHLHLLGRHILKHTICHLPFAKCSFTHKAGWILSNPEKLFALSPSHRLEN